MFSTAEARVELEFTGQFRELCKCRKSSIELDGEVNLLTLIRKLSSVFGDAFEKKLGIEACGYDEESVMVILNGVVIDSSRLESTIVKPGDHIVFAPSLASGG